METLNKRLVAGIPRMNIQRPMIGEFGGESLKEGTESSFSDQAMPGTVADVDRWEVAVFELEVSKSYLVNGLARLAGPDTLKLMGLDAIAEHFAASNEQRLKAKELLARMRLMHVEANRVRRAKEKASECSDLDEFTPAELQTVEIQEIAARIKQERADAEMFLEAERNAQVRLDPKEPSAPEICGLFYTGEVNEIHCAPGVGKTNVALSVALKVMRTGESVLYIDPESNARKIERRLDSFGITDRQWFDQFRYFNDITPEKMEKLIRYGDVFKPKLVVIDGLAGISAAYGKNEDKAEEILPILEKYCKAFTKSGAAVLVVDHIAKNSDGNWSRGSGAKKGFYKGAVLFVDKGKPYGPNRRDQDGNFVAGKAGFVSLKVTKDNEGSLGTVGEVVAELHFTPYADQQFKTITEWKAPHSLDEEGGQTVDNLVLDVVRFVNSHMGAKTEEIKKGLKGKNELRLEAINSAVEAGYIREKKDGKSRQFYFVKWPERDVNLPALPV
jgi:hypothetical protein